MVPLIGISEHIGDDLYTQLSKLKQLEQWCHHPTDVCRHHCQGGPAHEGGWPGLFIDFLSIRY